jgi:membrane-associated PAP2 superfamily phosphatase
MGARHWWLAHAGIPLLLLAGAFGLLHLAGGDRAVVGTFHDAASGRWQLEPVAQELYGAERALVMGALAALLGLLAAGLRQGAARRWRRPVAYLLLCFAATTGLVALGKRATNVDCPRALADYGGPRPGVGLLEDRPDDWPRAQCFPAGHSAGGFAWVALYFALMGRWRWVGLGTGVALGLGFGATQWARGMHFPSHDVASAAVAWIVALAAHAGLWRKPRRNGDAPPAG